MQGCRVPPYEKKHAKEDFSLDSCRAGLVTSQGLLRHVPHRPYPDPWLPGHATCSVTQNLILKKGLTLGLMLCSHYLEILTL